MKKIKIKIEGMHCASCALNIEKSLNKLEGVDSVGVSIMTNKAIVQADENVSEEDLKKAVSRAGYKIVSIE